MPAVGQRFGQYELIDLLGHGDTGTLYKARDVRLGRTVALRLVPPDMTGEAVIRARLNREVSVLASLDHPNVPPIYEAGELDDRIYIASRWIDGVDLGTLVRQEGPLEPRRAVRIVNQVASALQAAHSVQVMNRHVKPGTVVVTATDHAYLTDFALARRSTDITGLTVQERLVGDLDYLAPEYLAGGEADERVDIYGLGCVLFEALTGEAPFGASGAAAKMYAHASAEPPSPRARRAEIPERLDAVVRRALSKDPAQRQQSAGEFAVEAAGAVDLSAPPWSRQAAAGSTPAPPVDGAGAVSIDGAGRLPQPSSSDADAPVVREGFHEPVYYRGDRRVRRPGGRVGSGGPGGSGPRVGSSSRPRSAPRPRRAWIPWAIATLIFVGAAFALLVAVLAR